jgi:hypothetical protein
MIYDRFIAFSQKHQQGEQLYAHCPFHDDSTPSFTVNSETHLWYCHGCVEGGAEKEFVAKWYGVDTILAEKAVRHLDAKGKWLFPSDITVQNYHVALTRRTADMLALAQLGISATTINTHKLGVDDTRIVFPIFSRTGKCVNLRKYLPSYRRDDADKAPKMLNEQFLGSNPWYYPYSAFSEDEIVIVEGEKDCLIARSLGINAVTGTGGATIPKRDIELFTGKQVYVATDTDRAGNALARKYFTALVHIARGVSRIALPTKDFADYVARCKESNSEIDIMQYVAADGFANERIQSAQKVSMVEAEVLEHHERTVSIDNVIVVGAEPQVYTVPVQLSCVCNHADCKRPCALATTATSGQGMVVEVPPRYIVSFADSKDFAQTAFVFERFRCKKISTTPVEFLNVQRVIFQESASFVDGLADSTSDPRYGMYLYTDKRLDATKRYDIVATRVTDPRTQKICYVIHHADDVATHIPSPDPHEIDVFRQVAAQHDSAESLLQYYYDMWLPTLGIEGRLDLFGAILLTYCSVTEIPWKNDTIKGWLDVMCIGDTRTGKSWMVQRFVRVLQMGAYINGENARRTGVIGGMQQIGGNWIITWGAVPINDGGLLIIDEASGLSVDDVKNLSSTRSAGAVTINGIVKGEARARTRLVWLSNPRAGDNIYDYYWRGYDAFKQFIPAIEDMARFDIVVAAAREDIDEPKGVPAYQTVDFTGWRHMISQAWSVAKSNIVYAHGFEDRVRAIAREFNAEFGGGALIIGVAVHEKLLRFACAFAVLCGSFDGDKLMVTEQHVRYATEFMRMCLNKESMSYGEYVRTLKAAQAELEKHTQYVQGLLVTHRGLKLLLIARAFRGNQFQEVLGLDRETANKVLGDLCIRGLVEIAPNGSYKPVKLLTEIARKV